MAAFLGRDPGDIVFTSGGTESANLAVLGPAEAARQDGGEAVLLCFRRGAPGRARVVPGGGQGRPRCAELPVDHAGIVDPDALARTLSSRIASVAVMTANNETGRDAAAGRPRRGGAPARARARTSSPTPCRRAPYVDLAGSRPAPTWCRSSAHKVGGPVGVGGWPSPADVVLEPRQYGGGQERERRSGTQDVAGAVGLATALRLVAAERAAAAVRVAALRDRLRDGLLRRGRRGAPHACRAGGRRAPGPPAPVPRRGSSARSSWWRSASRASASRAVRPAPAGRSSPATSSLPWASPPRWRPGALRFTLGYRHDGCRRRPCPGRRPRCGRRLRRTAPDERRA